MDRNGRTVEPGRRTRSSLLLPGGVLIVTLALGAAAVLRFTAMPEAPAAREAMPSTPAPEPVAAEPVAVEPAGAEAVAGVPVVPVPVVIVPEVVVPEGRPGLVEAMRRGELRPGSRADLERWLAVARASGPSIDPGRLLEGAMDVFVIEADLMVPSGLTGAHAVIFVRDAGKPFPRGDLGHSLVLDVASGGCIGATCRIMLSH